jgi:hypothetical protein
MLSIQDNDRVQPEFLGKIDAVPGIQGTRHGMTFATQMTLEKVTK